MATPQKVKRYSEIFFSSISNNDVNYPICHDRPAFLFSDSNFEASCAHVDLSKTATWIIIFTNGLYTFATLFIEKLFKQKRNTQNVKGSVYILPLTLKQRLFNESQLFVCKLTSCPLQPIQVSRWLFFVLDLRKDRRVMKTNLLVVVVFFSRHSSWLLHKTKTRNSQTFGLRLLHINDKWIHTWYFSIAFKWGGRCLGLFVSVSKNAGVKHS